MAVAVESLVIETRVDDKMTALLAQMGEQVKRFGAVAAEQFGAAKVSAETMTRTIANAGQGLFGFAGPRALGTLNVGLKQAEFGFEGMGKSAKGVVPELKGLGEVAQGFWIANASGAAAAEKTVGRFGKSLGAIGAILRRSPLLIGADIAARVAGFQGVFDLFNKTMDGIANSVTAVGVSFKDRLIPFVEDGSRAIKSLNLQLAELQKQLAAARGADTEFIPFGKGLGIDVSKIKLAGLEEQEAALTNIEVAVKRAMQPDLFGEQRKVVDELNDATKRLTFTVGDQVLAVKEWRDQGRAIVPIWETIVPSIAAAEKELAAWNARLASGAQVTREWAAETELANSGLARAAVGFANLGAEMARRAFGLEEWKEHLREMKERLKIEAAQERFKEFWGGLATVFAQAAAAAAQAAQKITQAENAFAALQNRGGFEGQLNIDVLPLGSLEQQLAQIEFQYVQGLAALNDYVQAQDALGESVPIDKFQEYLATLQQVREQQEQAAIASTTFAGGIKQALESFSTASNQLGQQLVGGTFGAFRTLFRDVITGAGSATERLKAFARSFLENIADMIAQMLALKVVSAIFGVQSQDKGGEKLLAAAMLSIGFGFAKGGIVQGGLDLPSLPSFAAGGVTNRPMVARVGDNKSRREAIVPLPGAGRGIPVEFKNEPEDGQARARDAAAQAPKMQDFRIENTVHLTLNVGSLDPRGAKEVVLGASEEIVEMVAQAIYSGSDAGLRRAIQSVGRA